MTLYNPSSLASRMSESLESHSLMRESILGPMYETKSLWFWTLRLLLNSTMFCRCVLSSFFFTWLSEFEFSAICNCSRALISLSREAIINNSNNTRNLPRYSETLDQLSIPRFSVELFLVFEKVSRRKNTFDTKIRLAN